MRQLFVKRIVRRGCKTLGNQILDAINQSSGLGSGGILQCIRVTVTMISVTVLRYTL